jgi:DivIVA domain-containing protein
MSALTSVDVCSATFDKPPRGKGGYDEKSVNDFLQWVARRLEGHGDLSAEDVRGICFPKPRIGKRGYDEDQVDALLDQIATLDASS